jgi:hypothetical protein
MNAVEAQKLADKAFENPQTAIDAIITEELGIDKEELGGSWEAAAASFVLLPLERLFHYILYVLDGKDAVLLSVGSSVVGLWDRSRYHFTRKSILFSDLDRFLLIGRRRNYVWNWLLIGVSLQDNIFKFKSIINNN